MIHPTAVVAPLVAIGSNVRIGAFAFIEDGVTLGDGCVIANHAVVRTGSEIGPGVVIDSYAVVGGLPQMKIACAAGRVRIGARTILREGVTINRATSPDAATSIGQDCLLMANTHVAHDANVGNGVTMANNVMIAGHVEIGDGAFLGGGVGVHQFVRIGRNAMIGGNASISYDVAPFVTAAERNEICGLNLVGLRRSKMSPHVVADLKRCYHAMYCGPGDLRQRAERALSERELGTEPEGRCFLEFFLGGKRGFARARSEHVVQPVI
ncbi:MAG TPA: acyl-ACP--UDP-N-acetylglucosamine O-acyltransferase [Planctomycetota bacterium]